MREVALTKHQKEFYLSDTKFTLLAAGIGCVHESTLIDTPHGKVPIADIKTNEYYSLSKKGIISSLGSVPFPKQKGDLYRVVLEQDEFVAHGSHLVFSSGYEYRRVDDLLEGDDLFCPSLYSYSQILTNLDISLSGLLSNDVHLIGKVSSYLDDYLIYCHQYGQQPLPALSSAQVFAPLLIDALKFCLSSFEIYEHMGALREPELAHNHLDQRIDLRAKPDSLPRVVGLVSALEDLILASILEHTLVGNPRLTQFLMSYSLHHREQLLNLCHILAVSLSRPYTVNKIKSIEKHSFDWYWDLQVPDFHNYVAHGCIHHNSGKSYAGSHYVVKKVSEDPKAKGLIGANTYRQLHNSTLSCLFRELDDLHIPFNYNQNKGILSIFSTKILCASLDNYDVLRGIEIGWFWLDEVRDTKHEAFLVLMGRLRDKNAKKLEGRLTSSPSGFNWLYDYFAGDKASKHFRLIHAKSMDNPFLPDGYLSSLEDSYDKKVYEQEVLGKFVNITTGRVYYAFERAKHVKPVTRNTGFPLYLGQDFNINPMTAVVFQNYDNKIHVLDEFYIMTSNTHEMAQAVKEKYGTMVTYPDSTGKALKTSSAGISDHRIMEMAGFKIVSPGNPFRVDRYNAVNNLLEKERIEIDPKCVKLIRDLEQVSYKEGTSLPDVSKDKTLTHISDALGYPCYHMHPIAKPRSKIKLIER